jgi:hypothetical protein
MLLIVALGIFSVLVPPSVILTLMIIPAYLGINMLELKEFFLGYFIASLLQILLYFKWSLGLM